MRNHSKLKKNTQKTIDIRDILRLQKDFHSKRIRAEDKEFNKIIID